VITTKLKTATQLSKSIGPLS